MSKAGANEELKSAKAGLDGCDAFLVLVYGITILALLYLSVKFWLVFLPPWGAILLGIPLGALTLFLFAIGQGSLMELTVRFIILLILASIMLPVLQKARENGLRRERVKILKQQMTKRQSQSQPNPTIAR